MGFALSVIGLSFADFCGLQMREFAACCKAYNAQREAEIHGEWERMRMLATITIQPHVKGKMTPQKLLPFEWDKNKSKKKTRQPGVGREESKARFVALAKISAG